MPYHSVRGQSRVCITEGGHDVGERAVLGGFVVQRIHPFEFHTDGEIVASRTPVVAGLTRMPGPIREFDKLRQAAVARHEQVRRHTQLADFGKIGMQIERQCIREQALYPWAAEFPGRHADAVHDYQVRFDTRRAHIVIWRRHLPRVSHQSAFDINLQLLSYLSDTWEPG